MKIILLKLKRVCFGALSLCALIGTLAGSASGAIIDSSYSFGDVDPGSPSSLADEENRLVHLINLYNGDPSVAPDGNTYSTNLGANVPAPDLPAYDGLGGTGQLAGGFTSATIDFGTGWDYLMIKWANVSYYYYVGGLTGNNDVTNDVVFNKKGKAQDASHYRFFNEGARVPEGGVPVAMLGVVLLGMFGFRRLFL
ncbi:MAG: hypothetical protein R3F19_31105 [Verrucomicrobiales bacterium]